MASKILYEDLLIQPDEHAGFIQDMQLHCLEEIVSSEFSTENLQPQQYKDTGMTHCLLHLSIQIVF
jgi:hypothetical protein